MQEFSISIKILQNSAYTVGDYIDSVLIHTSLRAFVKLQVQKQEVTKQPSTFMYPPKAIKILGALKS